MAYVTATNGETFFLWPMPEGSARGISPGIEFNDVSHELGNGYWAQELYGSEAGLRTWEITQNTLGGDDCPLPYVTGVNGEEVSQEAALWDLYCEQKVSGKPFAYTCPRDGNTYLVRFNDTRFQYEKEFNYAQYAGKVTLSQVREHGVTIYDYTIFNKFAYMNDNSHFSPTWAINGANVSSVQFDGTGCTFAANPQNGHNTVRLTSGSSSRLLATKTSSPNKFGPVFDIFIVMKMREATFATSCGIITDTTTDRYLVGSSGTALFANLGHSNYEYRLNGNLYAQSAQAAPMNVFGVVHLRFKNSITPSNQWQIGKDRTTASTFPNVDIGEILFNTSTSPIPMPIARQVTEHLCVKWAVNT